MEDTAYRIIIMAQADQALHHIVLHVKQSFSNETAKEHDATQICNQNDDIDDFHGE